MKWPNKNLGHQHRLQHQLLQQFNQHVSAHQSLINQTSKGPVETRIPLRVYVAKLCAKAFKPVYAEGPQKH